MGLQVGFLLCLDIVSTYQFCHVKGRLFDADRLLPELEGSERGKQQEGCRRGDGENGILEERCKVEPASAFGGEDRRAKRLVLARIGPFHLDKRSLGESLNTRCARPHDVEARNISKLTLCLLT